MSPTIFAMRYDVEPIQKRNVKPYPFYGQKLKSSNKDNSFPVNKLENYNNFIEENRKGLNNNNYPDQNKLQRNEIPLQFLGQILQFWNKYKDYLHNEGSTNAYMDLMNINSYRNSVNNGNSKNVYKNHGPTNHNNLKRNTIEFENEMSRIPSGNNAIQNGNNRNGIQEFSVNLFETVSKNQSRNILISPLSANIALTMVFLGSAGNTRIKMQKVLHLPDNDQATVNGYRELTNTLKNIKGVTLEVLNKIFMSNRLKVEQTFKSLLSAGFQSEEEEMDFVDSTKAAKSINAWVSKNTNDKIKNIVHGDTLSKDTEMFIANVIYFKGKWKYKFLKSSDQMFYTVRGKENGTLVPTINRLAKFKYAYVPALRATFLEIPYKDDGLIMLIVLPDDTDGLEEVEKKIKTLPPRQKGSVIPVDLYLPKFKAQNTIVLNNALQEMGLAEMFTSSANFTRITKSNTLVTKVLQKTFIEVSEEGTEAAAVTCKDNYEMIRTIIINRVNDFAIANYTKGQMLIENYLVSVIKIRKRSAPPFILKVDHPFHYKIIKPINDEDGIVLFTGNCKYIENHAI